MGQPHTPAPDSFLGDYRGKGEISGGRQTCLLLSTWFTPLPTSGDIQRSETLAVGNYSPPGGTLFQVFSNSIMFPSKILWG